MILECFDVSTPISLLFAQSYRYVLIMTHPLFASEISTIAVRDSLCVSSVITAVMARQGQKELYFAEGPKHRATCQGQLASR